MNQFRFAFFGLGLVTTLAGCATTSQDAAPPQADANALRIMERVKAQPTAVFGGGMVYELFVGQKFTARMDQRENTLTLRAPNSDRTCSYDKNGFLQATEGAAPDTPAYCHDLAASAGEFTEREREQP